MSYTSQSLWKNPTLTAMMCDILKNVYFGIIIETNCPNGW